MPTKFIGGNIGSYTEIRKQTWEQRDKGDTSENDSPNTHDHHKEKPQKSTPGPRFASPQTRLTQARPATAAHPVRTSTAVSAKEIAVRNNLNTISQQPKLTKPVVSKPALVAATKPIVSKVAQKKEAQKQVLASTAQKTVMRGKGSKKEPEESLILQDNSELKNNILSDDQDVRIETEGVIEDEIQTDGKLSETLFGTDTTTVSRPVDESKEINTFQFEGSSRLT